MVSPDDLAAALPEPTPDDPPDLRRDLLDEIGDHLCCALQREELAGAEEGIARESVVKRFGDPRAVVRQLWFDALKERLVSQRITMVAALVFATAGVVACGILWSIADTVESVNRAWLAESREASRQLLAALVARDDEAAVPVPSPEWNPLTVELVTAESGEPLPGWTVWVIGRLHDNTVVSVERSSDEHGRIRFGLVRPGQYDLAIHSPWEERSGTTFTVLPGEQATVRVECPASAPARGPVELEFDVAGAEAIEGSGHALLAKFVREPRVVAGLEWRTIREFRFLRDDRGRVYQVEYVPGKQDAKYLEQRRELVDDRVELPRGDYEMRGPIRVREIGRNGDDGDRLWTREGIWRDYGDGTSSVVLPLVNTGAVDHWKLDFRALTGHLAAESIVSESKALEVSDFGWVVEFLVFDRNDDGLLTAAEFSAGHGDAASPDVEFPLDLEGYVAKQRRSVPSAPEPRPLEESSR